MLCQIAFGDREAFARLFHLYRNKIYNVAFRLTHSSFLAEEIVQEVFLKIWRDRAKLTKVQHFENYLFIIARNQVYTNLKQISRKQKLEDELSLEFSFCEDATVDKMTSEESTQIINQAVTQLSEQQRKVYLMSKEQGLSRNEIAKSLRISPETVKTHLERALKSIRAYSLSKI
ncbi:RNA polymerase sigma-70 factor [Marinilongibacter aquaticus]|uniref:RNA polymerase sigma factor n=1 Tax=Marinilongibacter aquaticus TaxID=2975157 RepID=UPI0021BD1EC1|nr:RNA polymerase sigma-70 factor [Marinilongibacter aquaticus]UBM58670.1 RNA polymerase sigma-70 factor [Marinilongibacter aquaticus]